MIKRDKYIFFYYGIVQEEIEEYYTFEETKTQTHRIYLPCAHTHTLDTNITNDTLYICISKKWGVCVT